MFGDGAGDAEEDGFEGDGAEGAFFMVFGLAIEEDLSGVSEDGGVGEANLDLAAEDDDEFVPLGMEMKVHMPGRVGVEVPGMEEPGSGLGLVPRRSEFCGSFGHGFSVEQGARFAKRRAHSVIAMGGGEGHNAWRTEGTSIGYFGGLP